MQRICLIGAGNVGYHLGQQLVRVGREVVQVFSREQSKAAALAQLIGAEPIHRLESVCPNADLYLLAVSDDAIEPVATTLGFQLEKSGTLAHTSGAIPSTVLANHAKSYGIFYPLQSFNRSRMVDWAVVPLIYYSPEGEVEDQLRELAEAVSGSPYRVDDTDRRQLHLAAVFANNFTNYLLHVSSELLSDHSLPFELLLPLIRETVDRLEEQAPKQGQTGPAIRRDAATMRRHLQLLEGQPDWAELYKALSKGIQRDL